MKKSILLILFASTAMAGGGSSTGPSLCSYGEYTCADAHSSASVVVCPFKDQTYVGLSDGTSSKTHLFDSTQVQVPSGDLGAGVEFSGNDIDLKIQTDAAPSPEGWPGVVTVPSLGLDRVELRCRKSRRFSTNSLRSIQVDPI